MDGTAAKPGYLLMCGGDGETGVPPERLGPSLSLRRTPRNPYWGIFTSPF